MEINQNNFDFLLQIWIGIAIIAFIALHYIKAPFGRHTHEGFGKMMNNSWGWFIMEVPSFIIIITGFIVFNKTSNPYSILLVLLWSVHYANRSFIFPFRLQNKEKKIPLAIVGSAIFFNLINAGTNAYYLGQYASYPIDYYTHWNFILGSILFVSGFSINLWADHQLLNLRKNGAKGYILPQGGLFNYIASPNLSGEILEWIGFALIAQNYAAWAFAIWTMANLIPRCKDHYQWSKKTFQNYPKKRKILIPFIY